MKKFKQYLAIILALAVLSLDMGCAGVDLNKKMREQIIEEQQYTIDACLEVVHG